MSKPTKIIQNPYEDAAELRDGIYQFSFKLSPQWLEKFGKYLFGSNFKIFKEDESLLYRLLVYAVGDEENATRLGMSLDKGLLLIGPVGCGKASWMKLLNYFFPIQRQYKIHSSRNVAFEFEVDGFVVMQRYAGFHQRHSNSLMTAICFKHLGLEPNQKYYGNECNVMAEILLSRYDLFLEHGILTHASSELSARELEDRYGKRVRSCMRSMFNLVAFARDAKDKR